MRLFSTQLGDNLVTAGTVSKLRPLCQTKLSLVEDDPKSHFSIATTPRCKGGRYSFPWIAPLYPWSPPYNAEC